MGTVIVTGAEGLLGRSVMGGLRKQGVHAVGVVRPSGEPLPNDPSPIVQLDLSSNWSSDPLPKSIDTVIHLAQSRYFREFPNRALDIFKVNIESTARLLDYAIRSGARRFVYASSGGIYRGSGQPFHENSSITPPGELGYYLGSKAAGEILVQSYASVFQVIVLRPFFIYGPGQNRKMLIPRLWDAVASGKRISLHGPNGIRLNPIHVGDAAKAVLASFRMQGCATFNLAGPDVFTIREIAEAMGSFLEKTPQYDLVEGVQSDLVADISAMKKTLVAPQRRLTESFADLVG